jgi:hypothetical protein
MARDHDYLPLTCELAERDRFLALAPLSISAF